MSSYNCEVIALDNDEKCVDRMADIVTQSMMCDITDINQLREAGVQDCDIAIVSMGSHLEESVMGIINLKELGVPYIVAKAKTSAICRYSRSLEPIRLYARRRKWANRLPRAY